MPVIRGKGVRAPRAMAFDCYRTLFTNDHADWRAMFREIVRGQGLPVDNEELWTRWRRYEVQFRQDRTVLDDPASSPAFKSYEKAWTECFERVFADLGFDGDAAAAGAMCVRHLGTRPIFPETVEALKALKGRVKLGVFSNADDASLRPLLRTTGLTFDAIESSESTQVYKPARAAFDRILSALGVPAGEAWYVGDHLYDDVVGAHGAGITSVWINRNGENADGDVLPDIEIKSLLELPELVKELS